MKKLFIFLMTIISISMFSVMDVKADTSSFYEGEYIDGVYMNRVINGTTYYQRARFFNQAGTYRFAYCVEPFATMNESSTYTSSDGATNLNAYQIDRIKKIAYYGYGYYNHMTPEWYAITQMLIWQVANPGNDFYFTDSLNGNRVNYYDNAMNEINKLADNYDVIPTFSNTTYDLVEGDSLTLTDDTWVLTAFTTDSDIATIDRNQLIMNNLSEGEYTINLTRAFNYYGVIPIFYNALDSQNVMLVGDLNSTHVNVKVNVKKTGIDITKVDSETKDISPQGEASLSGAIYSLYDSDMNFIDDIIIDEDMKGYYGNLKYGKYYLQEKEAGVGYLLDSEIHEIEITKDNPIIELSLENQVIKKEIKIHKQFGNLENFVEESGISFNVFDSNDNLVDTIITDSNGYASITLPYGHYRIEQLTTTDGYDKVDDILINVENEKDEVLELYDYKIEVPNTGINKSNNNPILIVILGMLYVKEIIFG